MKELSIEKNAKAYTELINRLEGAKDAIKKQNYGIAMDILCKPYPEYQITTSTELAEREDEEIRKSLIEMVHDTTGDSLWIDYNVHKEDAIDWLENQGEHANFRNKIQVGDKVTRNEDGVLVNLSQLNRVAKKDEKQGEQKPNKCMYSKDNYTDEDRLTLCDGCEEDCELKQKLILDDKDAEKASKEYRDFRESCGIKDPVMLNEIEEAYYEGAIRQYKPVEPQQNMLSQEQYAKAVNECVFGEQKPWWGDEDEKMRTRCAACLGYHYHDELITKKEYKEAHNWLDSLKDRVQPKQEWSEEDERIRLDTIELLEKAHHPSAPHINGRALDFSENINWLKSLRPQPKQEWSEEDIVAIDCAVEVLSKDLPSLAVSIERLKSLRPHTTWKPSEEQMKALSSMFSIGDEHTTQIVASLYNDLKKLREE